MTLLYFSDLLDLDKPKDEFFQRISIIGESMKRIYLIPSENSLVHRYLLGKEKSNDEGQMNDVDEDRARELHNACREGNLETIKDLIQNYKIDVNTPYKDRSTRKNSYPLSTVCGWAQNDGHINVVKYLLEKGADRKLGNPLRKAVCKDRSDIVKLLLEGDDELDVNIGKPLLVAACCENKETVKLLLERGGLKTSVLKQTLKHLKKRGNGEPTLTIKKMIEEELGKRCGIKEEEKEIFCFDEIEKGIYVDSSEFYEHILEVLNHYGEEGEEVIVCFVGVDQERIKEILEKIKNKIMFLIVPTNINDYLDYKKKEKGNEKFGRLFSLKSIIEEPNDVTKSLAKIFESIREEEKRMQLKEEGGEEEGEEEYEKEGEEGEESVNFIQNFKEKIKGKDLDNEKLGELICFLAGLIKNSK